MTLGAGLFGLLWVVAFTRQNHFTPQSKTAERRRSPKSPKEAILDNELRDRG
jgi:hypothetical protein